MQIQNSTEKRSPVKSSARAMPDRETQRFIDGFFAVIAVALVLIGAGLSGLLEGWTK
jgi:hypothetical protein